MTEMHYFLDIKTVHSYSYEKVTYTSYEKVTYTSDS